MCLPVAKILIQFHGHKRFDISIKTEVVLLIALVYYCIVKLTIVHEFIHTITKKVYNINTKRLKSLDSNSAYL